MFHGTWIIDTWYKQATSAEVSWLAKKHPKKMKMHDKIRPRLMGASTMGGLLPHFFVFNFFCIHLFSTKNLSKVLRFFLLLTFSGKIGEKFAREVLKLAF